MRPALIAPAIFVLLELSNVLTLYFAPGSRRANGVGVFAAWEKSQQDPTIAPFVRYLVYWVAGTKLIFIGLLCAVAIAGDPGMQRLALIAMVVAIASFYWRLFPLIRQLDRAGQIAPRGYSTVLGVLIAGFMLALGVSAWLV